MRLTRSRGRPVITPPVAPEEDASWDDDPSDDTVSPDDDAVSLDDDTVSLDDDAVSLDDDELLPDDDAASTDDDGASPEDDRPAPDDDVVRADDASSDDDVTESDVAPEDMSAALLEPPGVPLDDTCPDVAGWDVAALLACAAELEGAVPDDAPEREADDPPSEDAPRDALVACEEDAGTLDADVVPDPFEDVLPMDANWFDVALLLTPAAVPPSASFSLGAGDEQDWVTSAPTNMNAARQPRRVSIIRQLDKRPPSIRER